MANNQATSLEAIVLNEVPRDEWQRLLREQNIGEARGQRWLPQTIIETQARIVRELQELEKEKTQTT